VINIHFRSAGSGEVVKKKKKKERKPFCFLGKEIYYKHTKGLQSPNEMSPEFGGQSGKLPSWDL
jgi:hypothetical protein